VQNMIPLVLSLFVATRSLTTSPVVQSSVFPEPGVLALLGGGLVGLAALIRRHFSN
jgi:PEP-CTERM motif